MYCTCIQLYDLEVIYGSCVNSSGIMALIYDLNVLYSGELLREKTFVNFEVLWLFAQILGRSVHWRHKWTIHKKVFSAKIVFSANS